MVFAGAAAAQTHSVQQQVMTLMLIMQFGSICDGGDRLSG